MMAQAAVRPWWRSRWAEIGLVAGMTLVAAALRFYAIAELLPGLYRDEAYNGLDAIRVLQGDRPLFFEANNGREPLFIYMLALGVKLWGRTPGALRAVSALIGTLTIPCFYWVGREMYGRRVALVVAVLSAFSVWMLNTSRIVLRAGLMLPLLAIALATLMRGLRLRRAIWMLLAGGFFGAGMYTYLAARMAALALIAFLAIDWRRQGRLWLKGWLTLILSAVLVAAPMIVYQLGAEGVGRVGQVSILNADMRQGSLLQAMISQGWRTFLGFVWRGDFIPRHNIPLRPFLAAPYAVSMLVGLWVGLRRNDYRAETVFCLIWLAVMLVPTWLAEGAPHMLRGSGILPVLFVLPALGLVEAARWLREQGHAGMIGIVALALMVTSVSVDNALDYHDHLGSEAVYFNYESGATELADDINAWLDQAQGQPRTAYIARRLWDGWPSVRFLCDDAEGLVVFDQADGIDRPAATGDVLMALWPFDSVDQSVSSLPAGRLVIAQRGALERQDLAAESRELYVTVRTAGLDTVPENANVRWEQGIRLAGHEIAQNESGQLKVTLYWRTDEPISADYTVFCHVLKDGRLVGQHDGAPASGLMPTSRWRPGDTVRDAHEIDLSEPLTEGEQIFVGIYSWPSMEHLHLLDADGLQRPETEYRLISER